MNTAATTAAASSRRNPSQGGGRGRGGRGGRGRGGRGGRGGAVPSSQPQQSKQQPQQKKLTRDERKAGRRAKQLQAMEKKAKEEDAYFRKCQAEAASFHYETKGEKELFGAQRTQGINFSKYEDIQVQVKPPSNSNKAELPPPMLSQNFDQLDELTAQLKRNVKLMKYESPTPIQKYSIPFTLAGHDLMCCAQTGSGKTCSFLLPIISKLVLQAKQNNNQKKKNQPNNTVQDNRRDMQTPAEPACVVLAPTRELAIQIELEAQKLTHQIPTVRPVCVYGGAAARSQLAQLAHASYATSSAANTTPPQLLLVATPGRLTDFVDRNLVSLSKLKFLCLDESDRMLDMGFEPQVRKLVQHSNMTPKAQRQTLLFSATFPPAIQKLAAEFLRDYVWIAVGRVGSTTDSITQKMVLCATPDKRLKLQLVVQAIGQTEGRTLIFCQKKRTATWLKKQLNKGGPEDGKPSERFEPIASQDIHGDRTQSQREKALEHFRSGECRVLVATDVAARGLDISGVEHVINMDLPNAADDFDSYVHRIGRTGRAGHTGLATSLFVPGDDPKVGNGRIADLLVVQLKEADQEVPEWLQEQTGNGARNTKRKQPFGATDVRSSNDGVSKEPRKPSGGQNGGAQGRRPGRGGRGRGRSGGRGRGRGGRGGTGRSGTSN